MLCTNKLINNKLYQEDLITTITHSVGFNELNSKSILITGGTGLVGSFLVDTLVIANIILKLNIDIYIVGRSLARLKSRFSPYSNYNFIHMIEHDVVNPFLEYIKFDYIIHAANNAHPSAIMNDPVGTILSNIYGTYNLLEYGRKNQMTRFLFISSGEVYGKDNILVNSYDELFSGYLNQLDVRSCYPISKRAAENLCISYAKQYNIDTVIARLCHTYGPNNTKSDNRASVQFIQNAINNEAIILNSPGIQKRSYCYIVDTASAIFTILLKGVSNEAYNVSSENSILSIADFAKIVAAVVGQSVKFKNPTQQEIIEQSPMPNQILNNEKVKKLNWEPVYQPCDGIKRTISILKEL